MLGSRFGWLEPGGELRTADVFEGGYRTHLKLEGIESRHDRTSDFDVVADGDSPLEPAVLARLKVRE